MSEKTIVVPPHRVRVCVESYSDIDDNTMRLNQKIYADEFADDTDELTFKNFRIAAAVIGGLTQEFQNMAEQLGDALEKSGGDMSKVRAMFKQNRGKGPG